MARRVDPAGAATLAALAVLLLLAPPSGRSPDGLEMLALAREWAGGPPSLSDPWYWPPLWPLLNLGPVLLGGETAVYVLNLLLAGLVAWPLARLAARAWPVAPGAASVATALLWVALPAVREQAAVLDARPLGWLLSAVAAERAVAGRWAPALLAALLAPLARPEGIVAPVLVGAVALWARQPRVAALAALALLPGVAWTAHGRAWERFPVAWVGAWRLEDLVALYGPASAPTPFRAWVLASGAPAPRAPFVLPDPLAFGAGLREVLGFGGLALAVAGAALFRKPAVLALGALPALLVALSPQSQGQLVPASNLIFAALPLVIAGGIALARLPALAAPLLLELGMMAYAATPPRFFEGTDVAAAMSQWLRAHRAPGEHVVCGYGSRSVARDGGLVPEALPSVWEEWSPPPGTLVLLSSVDVRGTDGGRAYEILTSSGWVPLATLSDDPTTMRSDHWLMLLARPGGAP